MCFVDFSWKGIFLSYKSVIKAQLKNVFESYDWHTRISNRLFVKNFLLGNELWCLCLPTVYTFEEGKIGKGTKTMMPRPWLSFSSLENNLLLSTKVEFNLRKSQCYSSFESGATLERHFGRCMESRVLIFRIRQALCIDKHPTIKKGGNWRIHPLEIVEQYAVFVLASKQGAENGIFLEKW